MPTDYTKLAGLVKEAGLIAAPDESYAIAFLGDGTMHIVKGPYTSAPVDIQSEGTIYQNSGLTTSATGAVILDLFTLPAGALYKAGKILEVTSAALHAATANAVTLSLNFGGTGSVGGAVTGGTTLASSGADSTSGSMMYVQSDVIKTGASAQFFYGYGQFAATTAALLGGSMSVTDTAAIQINLIINCAVAATDLTAAFWAITFCH